MKIGVIGAGRLGICFALLLDRGGYEVVASDIRSNYVAGLQRREIVTNEPGVADLLRECSIDFTTDTRRVIEQSDVIYIMVATPSRADGSYDTSAVDRVVEDVAESDFDLSGKILVIGCTTNPGDCQVIQDHLRDRGVHVLYNPEFIAQGSILRDLQEADMVLIGGEDPTVMARYQEIYQEIQPTMTPRVHGMSLTAAELVKIATNCFLTTKISYANMLGEVLIRSGLRDDVDRALAAVAADSRVGAKYMRYGYGYGGPCLPRDNRAFAHYAERIGLAFPLGRVVDQFNLEHTQFLIEQLVQDNRDRDSYYMPYITYKPGTDIVEESQQLAVCRGLLAAGFRVYVEPSDLIPHSLILDLEDEYGQRIQFRRRAEIDQPVYEVKI
jgi:nucleotide sugar dehydrogenase